MSDRDWEEAVGRGVLTDFFRGITGRLIGWGIGRRVYECTINPDVVLKVEDGGGSFQNVREYETWHAVNFGPYAKWFAPVEHISPCGMVLVMAKTQRPLKFPERMPVFLTDFNRENYGLYKGRVVCHDYGTNLLMEHGKTPRMRKADWR